MTYSMKKVVVTAMSLSGMALVIISFQNCAAPLSALQDNLAENHAPSDYTGIDTAAGGVLAGSGNGQGGDSFSEPQSGIVIRNTSVKPYECASSDATFSIEIYGAGSNPFVCMESFISGRDSSFRCVSNQFAPLANQADWKYSVSADKWSYSVKLANHDIYVPGLYRLYVQGRGATVAASFQVSSTASTLNCQPAAAVPSPIPAPSPSTPTNPLPGGSVVTASDLKWSGFTQVVKTVVGSSYVAYPVNLADLSNNANKYGQVASINGLQLPIQDRIISLSATPGDFSNSQCTSSYGAEISLKWTHESPPPTRRRSSCNLPTSGIVYINVSHVNPANGLSSCPVGKSCSFKLSNVASQ